MIFLKWIGSIFMSFIRVETFNWLNIFFINTGLINQM